MTVLRISVTVGKCTCFTSYFCSFPGKEFRAVFISTVRTTHLAERPGRVARHAVTECDGSVGDFGFLSDQKLLNTALTRAQSFVGVVSRLVRSQLVYM